MTKLTNETQWKEEPGACDTKRTARGSEVCCGT
jgi:hypothetical protein